MKVGWRLVKKRFLQKSDRVFWSKECVRWFLIPSLIPRRARGTRKEARKRNEAGERETVRTPNGLWSLEEKVAFPSSSSLNISPPPKSRKVSSSQRPALRVVGITPFAPQGIYGWRVRSSPKPSSSWPSNSPPPAPNDTGYYHIPGGRRRRWPWCLECTQRCGPEPSNLKFSSSQFRQPIAGHTPIQQSNTVQSSPVQAIIRDQTRLTSIKTSKIPPRWAWNPSLRAWDRETRRTWRPWSAWSPQRTSTGTTRGMYWRVHEAESGDRRAEVRVCQCAVFEVFERLEQQGYTFASFGAPVTKINEK